MRAIVVALLLNTCLFGVSCGSDSQSDDQGPIDFVPGLQDVVEIDDSVVGQDKSVPLDTGEEPADRYRLTFRWPESTAVVPLGTNQLFKVELIDQDFELVEQERVDFSLLAHDGGDADLSSPLSLTGSNGLASVVFLSRTVAPATYTLEARNDRAGTVSLEIEVTPPAQGILKIGAHVDGNISLHDVVVGLTRADDFDCSTFNRNPTYTPANAFSRTLPSLLSTFDYEDEAGVRYAVFATALGSQGSLAASACEERYIEANGTQHVDLELLPLVLNAAGTYDMVAVFDFTDAIPDNEWGEILSLIMLAVDNPTQLAADLVVMAIEAYLGTVVGSIVEWALDDFLVPLVDDAVNDWIANEAPEWLRDAQAVLQDLTQIIRRLELVANLRIAKVHSDFQVSGNEEWIGLALYWRLDCEGQQYTEDCRNELSLDDLPDSEFPTDILAGNWNGTITNFDQLSINIHSLQLNYGRLILFLINDLLLPELSDEEYHSLYDAAAGWIDCHAIAYENGFAGDFMDALGIDRNDIEGFCDDAVSLLFGPLELFIYSLAADSQISLSGHATLIDDNDDLVVDRIIDGSFDGFVQWSAGASAPAAVSAEWDAERQ